MSEERKVRARHVGLYDGHRRPGEVFMIASEAAFAASWMDPVGWTPNGATVASPTAPAGPSAADHAAAVARIAELEGLLADERAGRAKDAKEAAGRVAKLEDELAAAKAPPPAPSKSAKG